MIADRLTTVIVRASGRSSTPRRIDRALPASHSPAVNTGLPAYAGKDGIGILLKPDLA
jgi:hypothetical protein